MAKILLLEDDALIAESVVDGLSKALHTVDWVNDGVEAAQRLRLYQYDLAILDWNVPGKTGVDVCREYRSGGGSVPIIMLTGRQKGSEKVSGLDAGADDYVTKPFELSELNARIRAVLRRPAQTLQNTLTVGDLTIDIAAGKATRAGRELALLPKEMALLEFMMRRPNQIISVVELLNGVWSSESDSSENAVQQCLTRLRKKLDANGQKNPIVNIKGRGYRLEE